MLRVPAGVIAHPWRDGRRQVLLVRAVRHWHEVALDGRLARTAGLLCRQASTSDIIDASVALAGTSLRGDVTVLTSDGDDLQHLLSVLDVSAPVIEV